MGNSLQSFNFTPNKITRVITGKGQVYFINRFLGAITSAVSYTLLNHSPIPLKRPTSPFTYQQDNLYLFKI